MSVHSAASGSVPTEREEWAVGQHPAMASGWIVRPVLFGPRVTVLPECEGGHVVIKSERDARLIAAAPELLQAAQEAVAVAESWIHDQLDGTSGLDDALAELTTAKAAIAKALGTQA